MTDFGDFDDPLEEDANAQQAEADKQRHTEMAEAFADMRSKYSDVFEWLEQMADEDEFRATEKLIANDEPETQRQIIARCRYFRQWVDDGCNAVEISRADTIPPQT